MSEFMSHRTGPLGIAALPIGANDAEAIGAADARSTTTLILERYSSDRAIPVFHGHVSDSPIIVELDNSAAMKLASASQGADRIPTIEAGHDRIVAAVTRLIENGLLINSNRSADGPLHIRLSAIDID